MNVYTLFRPDGSPTPHVACATCNQIYGHPFDDKDGAAERCCTQMTCNRCDVPYPEGKLWSTHEYQRTCGPCSAIEQREMDLRMIVKAKVVDDHDGWVWVRSLGYNDGFFESVAELSEWLDEADEDPETLPDGRPSFAFACDSVAFDVDGESVLDNAIEEHFDDARDSLVGVAEFKAACDAFNAANDHVLTWHPDYKRIVRVP